MIIYALLQLVLSLLDLVLGSLDFELSTWEIVVSNITFFVAKIASGCRILAAYTDFDYLLILLGLSIAVATFYNLYRLIRWILRKIPFINVS